MLRYLIKKLGFEDKLKSIYLCGTGGRKNERIEININAITSDNPVMRASIRNLNLCDNPNCPRCMKISGMIKEYQIHKAMEYAKENGYVVFMETFSIPSRKGDVPKFLVELFYRAFKHYTTYRLLHEEVEEYIYSFEPSFVKSVMLLYYHLHKLVFVKKERVQEYIDKMEKRRQYWTKCIEDSGRELNEIERKKAEKFGFYCVSLDNEGKPREIKTDEEANYLIKRQNDKKTEKRKKENVVDFTDLLDEELEFENDGNSLKLVDTKVNKRKLIMMYNVVFILYALRGRTSFLISQNLREKLGFKGKRPGYFIKLLLADGVEIEGQHRDNKVIIEKTNLCTIDSTTWREICKRELESLEPFSLTILESVEENGKQGLLDYCKRYNISTDGIEFNPDYSDEVYSKYFRSRLREQEELQNDSG